MQMQHAQITLVVEIATVFLVLLATALTVEMSTSASLTTAVVMTTQLAPTQLEAETVLVMEV